MNYIEIKKYDIDNQDAFAGCSSIEKYDYEVWLKKIDEDMDFEKLKKPNNNCFVLLKNNQFDETETLKHSNEEYKSVGNIENISFNNVRVYVYDENIKPVINIFNYNECCEFKNIIFDGLNLNGNKQYDFSLFDVNLINVNDISLK